MSSLFCTGAGALISSTPGRLSMVPASAAGSALIACHGRRIIRSGQDKGSLTAAVRPGSSGITRKDNDVVESCLGKSTYLPQWTQNCNRRPGRASSVISARGLLSLPLPQASIDPAIDCSSQCKSASAALSMHHMPLSAFLSCVALNKQ